MSSTCSTHPLLKIQNSIEACSLVKDIEKVFSVSIDANDIEEKIKECEYFACCVLKKVDNLTTKKTKLICAKQKCPFQIRLENLDGRYYLGDILNEHNHSISKDKFEMKLLTGRLLDYAEFIYQKYFLTDSEFCSKPKLILKDLKNKYNIDLMSGDYESSQKQKLKKKFDNIVQQLRLKKTRSSGETNISSNSQIQKSMVSIIANKDCIIQSVPSTNAAQGDQTIKNGPQTQLLFSNLLGQLDPNIINVANVEQYHKDLLSQQSQIQTQIQQQNIQQYQFQSFPQVQQQFQPPQFPKIQQEMKYPLIHPFQLIQQQQSNLFNCSQKLQNSEGKQFNQILQVISEDSRSISQCKVEDQSEFPETQHKSQVLMISPRKILKSNNQIEIHSSANTLPISCQTQIPMAGNKSPLVLGSIQSIGANSQLKSADILTSPFENSCFLQQPILNIQQGCPQQIQYFFQQQLNNQLIQQLTQQLKYQEQQQQQQQQQLHYLEQNLLAGVSPISPSSQISMLKGNPTNSIINTVPLPFQQLHLVQSQQQGISQNQLPTLSSFQQFLLQSNGVTKPENSNINILSIFPPTISLEKHQESSNENNPTSSSSNLIPNLLPSVA